MEKKIPIVPYKELGLFCGGVKPKYYEIDKIAYLAMPTRNSFKIFTLPELKVKILGPTLEKEITSIETYNELLYVSVGKKIDEIEFEHEITTMLLYSTNLITALKNGEIRVVNVTTKEEISRLYTDFEILDIQHPETYLNKIVVVGENQLQIWNVMTGNKIYSFEQNKHFLKYFRDSKINCFELSPAIDFAAIGFNDGNILIFNMKKAKILQKFGQESSVENLAFSKNLKNKPL